MPETMPGPREQGKSMSTGFHSSYKRTDQGIPHLLRIQDRKEKEGSRNRVLVCYPSSKAIKTRKSTPSAQVVFVQDIRSLALRSELRVAQTSRCRWMLAETLSSEPFFSAQLIFSYEHC
jgi:hypothetical protein